MNPEDYDQGTLWILYGLRASTGPVRYVGITRRGVSVRLKQHSRAGSRAKMVWLSSLRRPPRLVVLGSIRGTVKQARLCERILSRSLGGGLLNREARSRG